MLDHHENACLSHWFPMLERTGAPVPRTEIVRTDLRSYDFLEPEEKDIPRWRAFHDELRAAVGRIGTPCFLRTGLGSGKHEWERTCHLRDVGLIHEHVAALAEWSEMVDMLGLPVNVWAVRELLPVTPFFHAFRGMPVVPEIRFFISGGAVVHSVPYWPEDAFEFGMDCDDWRDRLAQMNAWLDRERGGADDLAAHVASHMEGAWSLDLLLTSRGRWYATDMAPARQSWGCPEGLK